jgi:5-methylcytosine-specific restriction endonuclease McrA
VVVFIGDFERERGKMTDEEIIAMHERRAVRFCIHCRKKQVNPHIAYIADDLLYCTECAERIANAFWKRRTGKWLTYENPVSESHLKKKRKISHSIQKKVWERDAYRCVNCGSHIDLTVDHIVPESKGGTLDMDNLQTLCRSCNSRKGTK